MSAVRTSSLLSLLCFSSFLHHIRHRHFPPFPTRRSSDLLCLIFKLAPSVCRMTFPILASLLVRFVVLLPFQLLRLSLATPSRSEERFSRNAETAILCRILVQKQKIRSRCIAGKCPRHVVY